MQDNICRLLSKLHSKDTIIHRHIHMYIFKGSIYNGKLLCFTTNDLRYAFRISFIDEVHTASMETDLIEMVVNVSIVFCCQQLNDHAVIITECCDRIAIIFSYLNRQRLAVLFAKRKNFFSNSAWQ